MSVFPAAGHLASWARQAGKRKGKNATGRGNAYIGGTLGEASVSAGRTQTFLGARYRRMCSGTPAPRRGSGRRTAGVAGSRVIPGVVWSGIWLRSIVSGLTRRPGAVGAGAS